MKGLAFFLLAAIFVGALIWMATLKRPSKAVARNPALGPPAEEVLLDGKILTVDPHDSVAEAVAIGFEITVCVISCQIWGKEPEYSPFVFLKKYDALSISSEIGCG